MARQRVDLFRAQMAAGKLIQEFAFSRPEQIIVEDVAMARKVLVIDDVLHGAEARLLRDGQSGLIRVQAAIPEEGRRRYAIAHELGHWELHVDTSQWNFCTKADLLTMKQYKGSPLEMEANAFASHLLMPRAIFAPHCKEVAPSLKAIIDLAAAFRTTLTATSVRFVEECEEVCAVVFSENGKIKWWHAREDSDFWIEPGKPLDRRTEAWECQNGGMASTKMEPVKPEYWLDELPRGRKTEVFEQAMKLGTYPTVLTLLWIVEAENDE